MPECCKKYRECSLRNRKRWNKDQRHWRKQEHKRIYAKRDISHHLRSETGGSRDQKNIARLIGIIIIIATPNEIQ